MLVLVVCLFYSLFHMASVKEPGFLFCLRKRFQDPLGPSGLEDPMEYGNMVMIFLLVSTDRYRHFSEEEKGPFQV